MSNPSTAKRRWLRFSLRTMLLLITALCIWLGVQLNAARRQREAVAVLHNVGAEIHYDYQMVAQVPPAPPMVLMHPEAKVFDPNQLPPGPAWLRQLIGDDYFHNVVGVWLKTNAPIQKADLDELAKLPHVHSIVAHGNDRWIGDKDLAVLSQLPQLEELQLLNARLDGSFLASLPNRGQLKILGLNGSDIDDAAIKHIETMTGLHFLYLERTHVTDAGLVHLRNLKNLEALGLSGTVITDAGLEHLSGLQKLYLLELNKTRVSAAGVNKLRAALPRRTTIQWQY